MANTKEANLWGRYWITSGLDVVHRNDVTDLNMDRMNLYSMVVDKVVKRARGDDTTKRMFIEGVRCHWIDNDRKYQVGQFHTGELIPLKIATKGINEVNKWISRIITD